MTYLTKDDYEKSEKKQTIHRSINTLLMVLVVVLGISFVEDKLTPIYEDLSGMTMQRAYESEIAQIAADEGYKSKVYLDSLGKRTIGFGHLVKEGEDFTKFTSHDAVQLLRKDYELARKDVERNFPWAEGEAKLILINLVYNVGITRALKFEKTLHHMQNKEYDLAAGELLDSVYASQVGNRAGRLAGRLMKLQEVEY